MVNIANDSLNRYDNVCLCKDSRSTKLEGNIPFVSQPGGPT